MHLIDSRLLGAINQIPNNLKEFDKLTSNTSKRSSIFVMSSYIQGAQARYIWSGPASITLAYIYAFNSFLARLKYLFALSCQSLGFTCFFISYHSRHEPPFDPKSSWLFKYIYAIQCPPLLDKDKRYVLVLPLRNRDLLYIKVYLGSDENKSLARHKSDFKKLRHTYEPFFQFPKYEYLSVNSTICSLCVSSGYSRNLNPADLDYVLSSVVRAQANFVYESPYELDYYFICAERILQITSRLSLKNKRALSHLIDLLHRLKSKTLIQHNPVRYVFSHGDLVPWNIKCINRNFTLIDLDGAFLAPFGYDLIYLIMQSYAFNFLQLSQANTLLRRNILLENPHSDIASQTSISIVEAELAICLLVADALNCKNIQTFESYDVSSSMLSRLKKYSRIISVLL